MIERLKSLSVADKAWAAAFALLALLIVPRALGATPFAAYGFLLTIAITIMLHAIFALGLNVVVGWTGLLDLGYASFIAIGAFVVSLGLVLTYQPPRSFESLPVGDIVLTQAQRDLPARAGVEVVVRERFDLRFDVVSGAETVRAAQEAKQKTIAARHVAGLALPIGQTTAKGTQPFGRLPGGFFLLLLLGGLLAAAAGVVRGFPTLRLTGDYYAIVTLGFAEIVWLVTLNEEWLTGGAFGVRLGEYFPTVWGGKLMASSWQYYVICWLVLVLVVAAVTRLQRSRVGRAWAAIKADETAARSSGIDVDRYKLLAFAVSGFIGGVGGGLFAIKISTVTSKQFDIWLSIVCVCCLVLGGMGRIRGALLGAAILMGLGELLRFLSEPQFGRFALPPEARFLVYGLILVVLMRFRPQGVLPPRQDGPAPDEAELAALRARPSALFTLETKP